MNHCRSLSCTENNILRKNTVVFLNIQGNILSIQANKEYRRGSSFYPYIHMKNISSVGFALVFFFIALPSALAAETPTMNQPDNGFHEGADPEWATLHSTDTRGTVEHRQYHREGVRLHLAWHAANIANKGTAAYNDAHRLFHQNRNSDHRAFHTAPVNP